MKVTVPRSIFDGGDIMIPMADVQHIDKLDHLGRHNGIFVITKHTNWNFEMDMWDNPIYLAEEEAEQFIKAWCKYRYEKDAKEEGVRNDVLV